MTHDCKTCPVSTGTHKPAEAVQQIAEPALQALRERLRFTHMRLGHAEHFVEVRASVVAEVIKLADRQAARIAELEGQLEAIGAGGVEPLRKPAAAQQAEPFMWAIQEPGGGAYMDVGCVSSVREDVQAEVDGLNSGLDADDDPYQVVPVYLAAAPQAVQATVPLPLLVRDIARDLGITVPQACIALKPLGNYSTNSAVTAEMARMLRDHFPAPAHPAEGVPAPMPVAHPHHCTARTADGSCEECEGHAQAMAEWNAERAALAATQPAAQGMEKSACGYPELPAGSEACEFNSYAIVYDADEMREYVDADRRMRAALAAQAKQGSA